MSKQEIMIPSEPLKMGIPTNKCMRRDCEEIIGRFELEASSNGIQISSKVPNVKFFPVRVSTTANYLRKKVFQLGILGDDTAFEFGLEDLKPAKTRRESQIRIPLMEGIRRQITSPPRRVLSFSSPPSSNFSLLWRRESSQDEIDQWLSAKGARIVTSYPNLTRKCLFLGSTYARTIIEASEGQNEFLLRSMPNRFDLATDVVSTGRTANCFDLARRTLFKSRPGLWTSGYEEDYDQRMIDAVGSLRELLHDL